MCSKHRNLTRGPGTIRPDLDHSSWQKPLKFWCISGLVLLMFSLWCGTCETLWTIRVPGREPWCETLWPTCWCLHEYESTTTICTHTIIKCPCCWLSLAGQRYWSVNVCWWYPGYFLHGLAWPSVCYMWSDCIELMYCFVLDIKYEWLVFLNQSYPLCFYFKYTI